MKRSLVCCLLFQLTLFFFAGTALAQNAPDPIRLATGARTLGMGKAFVGLADDIDSIFINPAGLANPEQWQLTSMSGKLLEEYNYLSLSGLYPTQIGTFGLAFVGSSIGGALPTTIEAGSDPDDPVYVVDTSQELISYYNNLFILSYGNKIDRALDLPLLSGLADRWPDLRQTHFGANLKFFQVNLTGDGITGGAANGMELDLGVQGKPLPWLSLGANLQNALPFSMGGKLTYQTGWEESYPALLKLGSAVDLLGPKDALRKIWDHQLKLLLDMDYEVSRSSYIPALFHLGLEWKPNTLIGIRAGIDQDVVGAKEVANNLTTGVGLYYGNFRFDYAYHEFFGAPGIMNHFFSFSYGIAPVKRIETRLYAAPDKVITREAQLAVKGRAFDPDITRVTVNDQRASLNLHGEFRTEAALEVGKNLVTVKGLNNKGGSIEAIKLRALRLITYPDVAADHWAADQISYIGTLGIIKGYPDGGFKPEGTITRAELATLLVRTKMGGDDNVPQAEAQMFADVALTHWAAKYINMAAKSGIVKGYPDGSFKPSARISRAEGLAMIARFGGVAQVPYTDEFIDMDSTHWVAPIVAGAYKEGMLIHFLSKPFGPKLDLTRAEAVEMLYRSKPVNLLIQDLLDFSKGY
ncbi:MAG: S-layer homology domain-containing protein [Candidatus Saganbacteria bacterium]|nr:S-layer homology domain-containing protein [Candidatus Saganbacteria bacterium]